MSELISGKEALIALANGVEVQYISAGMNDSGFWSDSEKTKNFTIHDFYSGSWAFRLKPRTITINNIEVPAPFEPKVEILFISLTQRKNLDGHGLQHMSIYINLGISLERGELSLKSNK